MTDDLPDDFAASLDILASAAGEMQDPWWIFGGAAMVLWGLRDWRAPDIDVLCSPRDARRLIEALHGQVTPDPGEGLFHLGKVDESASGLSCFQLGHRRICNCPPSFRLCIAL
jgi:hypothetical protein